MTSETASQVLKAGEGEAVTVRTLPLKRSAPEARP